MAERYPRRYSHSYSDYNRYGNEVLSLKKSESKRVSSAQAASAHRASGTVDALCTITSGWNMPSTGSLSNKRSLPIRDMVHSKTELRFRLPVGCLHGFMIGRHDRQHIWPIGVEDVVRRSGAHHCGSRHCWWCHGSNFRNNHVDKHRGVARSRRVPPAVNNVRDERIVVFVVLYVEAVLKPIQTRAYGGGYRLIITEIGVTMFQFEKNCLTRRRHALTGAQRPDLPQG